MAIIHAAHWAHEFFTRDGRYYLAVPCGTVAVYDVTVELTADEFRDYEERGLQVVIALADQIRFRPRDFTERAVHGVYP